MGAFEAASLKHEIKKNTELLRELLARQMFSDHMHRNHPSGWHNWDLLSPEQQEEYYKRVDAMVNQRVGKFEYYGPL